LRATLRWRDQRLRHAATLAHRSIPLTHCIFWGPMAIAIMGGLTIATILTIFFVPALYAAWFKVQRQPKTATGTEPVAVEPAPAL
jgi:multidrug efflux pump